MDALHGEREPEVELCQARVDDAFALGTHGDGLGPAGGHVGGVQGEVEVAVVVAAVMADQVDL